MAVRKLVFLIIMILCTSILLSCNENNSDPTLDPTFEIKEYNLENIKYEVSNMSQKSRDYQMNLNMSPITVYSVGETVSISTTLTNPLGASNKYAYYIADWGDGTFSYEGPASAITGRKTVKTLSHRYRNAGVYKIKTAAVDLSNGTLYGWSAAEEVTITEGIDNEKLINNLKPIASSNEASAGNILDGENSYWLSNSAADSSISEWVGVLFDKVYSLSTIEVKLPKSVTEFGSNISLEYTTDGGKTWYSLPKYDYLNDYAIGRYSPIMRFPNLLGGTLVFAMDDINANGVRFSTDLFLNEARQFAVEEIRCYGDTNSLIYSSYSDTYNADLNNMWITFGTAKTEPIVYGSLSGESTNASPFRSGFAMIASTEWLEWNGLKINWIDYPELQTAYLEQLLNVKYGDDGWSNHNGYIYATSNSPKHLGEQNHYVYNSIFIIALRNYILQGNNTLIEIDGDVIDIMDHVNSSGQKMSVRLEKAMDYMLTVLEGTSGVLTINDPENDGTVNGKASNYWDVHRSFGYKSSYENIFYYQSLLAMADLKAYYGDMEKANYYLELAEKTKTAFNKLFWDKSKGRYITSVNVEGERLDYGMTFVNFMACQAGLASEEQAELIYSWVDGTRIIEGDTSQGSDIYGEFIYAARATTIDAHNITNSNGQHYWWDHGGQLPTTPGSFGGFGHQMQNGGTIFYISFYDVLGRIKSGNVDSAIERFNTIMEEYHKDGLRRNRYLAFTQNGYSGIGEYSEGVLGEFPESGLVPYTFIEGFIGIKSCSEGLEISPNLPSDMEYAGIREYHFGNYTYSIQVSKQITSPIVKKTDGIYFVSIPANKSYVITLDGRLVEKR